MRITFSLLMMSMLSLTIALFFAAAVGTTNGATVTVNFDDGPADGVPGHGADGVPIGNFYDSVGIVFSNGQWDDWESPNEGSVGAGGLKLAAITGPTGDPTYQPRASDPIIVLFNESVSDVSIYALGVGSNGARLAAYDEPIGGSLLGASEVYGVLLDTDNHQLLNVAASGIRRIELYQPLGIGSDGLLFDNLTFDVVPEPTGLALAVIGLSSVVWRRKRG